MTYMYSVYITDKVERGKYTLINFCIVCWLLQSCQVLIPGPLWSAVSVNSDRQWWWVTGSSGGRGRGRRGREGRRERGRRSGREGGREGGRETDRQTDRQWWWAPLKSPDSDGG